MELWTAPHVTRPHWHFSLVGRPSSLFSYPVLRFAGGCGALCVVNQRPPSSAPHGDGREASPFGQPCSAPARGRRRSTAPRGRSVDRDIEERDALAVMQSYFHQLAACGPAVWCSSTADAAC